MVGREGEMAALSEILQRSRNERAGRMATVIADAGTGKSRLIREFVDACDATSLVLRGRRASGTRSREVGRRNSRETVRVLRSGQSGGSGDVRKLWSIPCAGGRGTGAP